MKLCKDCKHYTTSASGVFDWCQHPRFGVNPVDGDPIKRFPSVERADLFYGKEDRCGTGGIFFEQKEPEPVKKFWFKNLVEKWKEANA